MREKFISLVSAVLMRLHAAGLGLLAGLFLRGGIAMIPLNREKFSNSSYVVD